MTGLKKAHSSHTNTHIQIWIELPSILSYKCWLCVPLSLLYNTFTNYCGQTNKICKKHDAVWKRNVAITAVTLGIQSGGFNTFLGLGDH